MKPVCVILAGGRSSRMGGGHKGLLPVDGVPMLEHVINAVAAQVNATLINSNDPELFESYDLPVLADSLPGYHGPLAGLLTGMQWARRNHPHATHMLSVPCDGPFLPPYLVARLVMATQDSNGIVIARDRERLHPTLGLWPITLAERLAADLGDGVRGMQAWLKNFAVRQVLFDAEDLRNINTREDLAALHSQPPCHLETSALG
jgi:molybdopterin-guanine dinucleotide biosynthesis protein A